MNGYDLARRLVSEALGTALLVATVVGSGIMAESLTSDAAVALLCNTLPTGAILVVLITISVLFRERTSIRRYRWHLQSSATSRRRKRACTSGRKLPAELRGRHSPT
jgi:hypothetical protein